MTSRIVIAGAGIGGLATALSLEAAGFTDIRVLEAAALIRQVGVGVNLPPHAVRELTELGLGEVLADADIGRPDLASDERWRRVTGRIVGRDDLVPDLCNTMLTRTTQDWIARLEAVDVPCGPINNYAQVFDDPQVVHRGLRLDVPRAGGGAVSTIASPLRLAATPVNYRQAPPVLGEHTDRVLSEVLGKDAAQIAALRAGGIV